ncbi:MAG: hypothetical protein ACOX3T_01320 [Bdellovibrionota bacterium]
MKKFNTNLFVSVILVICLAFFVVGCKGNNENAMPTEAQQPAIQTQNTDGELDATRENVSQNTDEPISGKFAEIIKAVKKDGYWFKDGTKPERMENNADRLRVWLDSEDGVFGHFINRFLLNDEKTPSNTYTLIWINKNKKPLTVGMDTFEALASAKTKNVLYNIDACTLFKKGPLEEYKFENGVTFINVELYCSDMSKQGFYAQEEIWVFWWDWKNKEYIAVLKLN